MHRCACAAFLLLTAVGCAEREPAPATQPGAAKPMRIASAMLATDEILPELVGVDRLVAVSVYVDDEAYSATRVPKHIARVRGEIESILRVKPDLVCVGSFAQADFLKLLERSGLHYYVSKHYHSLDEIRAGIHKLGELTGEPGRASKMVERMDARLAAVRRALAGVKRRPRVLHWSGGWTNAGLNTTVHDLIVAAGGVDVAADLGLKGPCEIASERVLDADPDYVLVSAGRTQMSYSAIEKHPVLKRLTAVRAGRVIRMPGPILMTVSHRLVDGVEWLARRLHPARFGPATQAEARDR